MIDQKWVIWSNEHDAWWRPNSQGYTTSFSAAGRYSLQAAKEICRGANSGCVDSKVYRKHGRPQETMLPVVCYGREQTNDNPNT